MAAILLVLIIAGFIAIGSETFWTRFIIPRFLGPYYSTALKWESLEPQVFPPGLTLRGVTLSEPGGFAVLQAEKMQVLTSYASRPASIRLRRVELTGVNVNYVYYEDGTSNFEKAYARLFEGKVADPPEPYDPYRRVVPRIHLQDILVDDLVLRYYDARFAVPLHATYITGEPVEFRVSELSPSFEPGRADNFFEAVTEGDLTLRAGDYRTHTRAQIRVAAPNLAEYPRNVVAVVANLAPEDRSRPERIRAAVSMPLRRVPVRPVATPFRDILLEFREAEGAEPFLRLGESAFDPLTGDLELHLRGDTTWPQTQKFIDLFLAPDSRTRFSRWLAAQTWPQLLTPEAGPVALTADASVIMQGVGQYAIVDEREVLPLKVNTKGMIGAAAMPLAGLENFQAGMAALAAEDAITSGPFIADTTFTWSMSAEEASQSGLLFAEFKAVPTGTDGSLLSFVSTLSDRTNPAQPLRFNPFAMRGLPDLSAATTGVEIPELPEYTVFPEYEAMVSMAGEQLHSAFALLDALRFDDSLLRNELQVSDRRVLAGILEPYFDQVDEATSATLTFSVARPRGTQASDWSAALDVEGLRLRDVQGEVNLAGHANFIRQGSLMTAQEFRFELVRADAATSETTIFAMGLPWVNPGGQLGPPRPTQIDLTSGVGHLELRADTINREIMEILLRVQTFGLSDQLAQPVYQRLLDVLGLKPGDPRARGEAVLHFTGEVGPVFSVTSLVQLKNLPAANFLFLPEGFGDSSETFDASLLQSTQLDRTSELLQPGQFELVFSPPGRPEEPFGVLRLEMEDNSAFSYRELQDFAAQEAERFQAADLTTAQSLRDFLVGFFQRTRRLGETLVEGEGRLLLLLPEVQLAQFRNTLQAAGLPIESGLLDLRVEASLTSVQAEEKSLAYGVFFVEDLLLTGNTEALPVATGTLNLTQVEDRLELRELATTLQFDPAFPPTYFKFEGAVDTNTLDSSWTLALRQINGAVLSTLQRFEQAGIAGSATVLRNLPLNAIAEAAGPNGSVDLTFRAETDGETLTARVEALQEGRDLRVLPEMFHPLSFSLAQRVETGPDGRVLITGLSGRLEEEGIEAPIATMRLSEPITFGGGTGEDAVLTLRAEKDLGDLRGRLADFPLPLFNRAVTGGLARGAIEVVFPGGSFNAQSEIDGLLNRFAFELASIRLEGYQKQIDARLSGTVTKSEQSLHLQDTELATFVGGESAGQVELAASYSLTSETLAAQLDVVDLTTLLLDALPGEYREWTRNPDSRLNVRAVVDAAPRQQRGRLEFSARARDLVLPPVVLTDGTTYEHAPLHLDLDFVSNYDQITSTVLLQNLNVLAAKGETPRGDRLARLGGDVQPLFAAGQSAPVVLNANTPLLAAQTADGARLYAVVGPVQMEEYGPLLAQFLGVPLTGGTLEGEAAITSVGNEATRLNRANVELSLTDGSWRGMDGKDRPFDVDTRLSVATRQNVFRVDDLTLRASYPDNAAAPYDHLSLNGFYEFDEDAERTELEAEVRSESLAIDRLLAYLADYEAMRDLQGLNATSAEDEQTTVTHWSEALIPAPRNTIVSVSGQLDNVTYREVSIPSTSFEAEYEGGIFELENFRSRLVQGDVAFKGRVDLRRQDVRPWSFSGTVSQLEARPFVNSFAVPELRDRVLGRIGADITLEAPGLAPGDLRQIRGDGVVRLREGQVDQQLLKDVVGTEAPLSADLTLVLRNNRGHFRLTTPWNPARDFLAQGVVHDVLSPDDRNPWYSAFIRFARTTVVGPRGRYVDEGENLRVPLRQDLFAVRAEAEGSLGAEGEAATVRVRTVEY